MDELRMAVVGVGSLGRHHTRILAGLAGVQLVAVADTKPEHGRPLAEQYGCRYVADATELFGEIDAAVIAVPTSLHETVAAPFLQRGIPLLVEKPLAIDSAAAGRLRQLAESTGAVLQVGHVERFNPVTALLPPTERVRYVRTRRCSPFPFRSMDISVVADVMIHDIDLLLALAGAPPESISGIGMAFTGDRADLVQARLTFPNGLIADLEAVRVAPSVVREWTVWCDDRQLLVDFQQQTVQECRPTAALAKTAPLAAFTRGCTLDELQKLRDSFFGSFYENREHTAPAADALTAELLSFVESVRSGCPPSVDATAALTAIQVVEAIEASIAGRRPAGSARAA